MMNRDTKEKIALFRRCFDGRKDAYGTRDRRSGQAWQVKQPVTDAVILAHLQGKQPYGVYLLVADRARAVVADFDIDDLEPPMEFRSAAKNYGLATHIERSKSKGYHVWMFLDERGVSAAKARLVVRHILSEIGQPHTEIFPKHDRLDCRTAFGNYIYAPLFGTLVPQGRTVFLDASNGFKPHVNQWQLLANVERVTEQQLDEIIAINELTPAAVAAPVQHADRSTVGPGKSFGLPPCAQRMLAEGVTDYQRVSCFRLAVHLKNVGIAQDLAVSTLLAWATKNRPVDGKRIITPREVQAQVDSAFDGPYRSFGCAEPAVQAFCDPHCPVRSRGMSALADPGGSCERHALGPHARSTTMSIPSTNRPVKEFCVRNLSLAIWQNEGTRDGRPVTLHSVTVNKRYRDPDTNEWKDSNSFFPDDLPRLRLLLDKAYEHIMLPDRAVDREKPQPSVTKAADEAVA